MVRVASELRWSFAALSLSLSFRPLQLHSSERQIAGDMKEERERETFFPLFTLFTLFQCFITKLNDKFALWLFVLSCGYYFRWERKHKSLAGTLFLFYRSSLPSHLYSLSLLQQPFRVTLLSLSLTASRSLFFVTRPLESFNLTSSVIYAFISHCIVILPCANAALPLIVNLLFFFFLRLKFIALSHLSLEHTLSCHHSLAHLLQRLLI